MSSQSIGGSISIQSHSKQIKLLNDYIISLEKKINEGKEQDSSKVMRLTEENNRLTTENVRIRNQNSSIKYAAFKSEEAQRKNAQLEKELSNFKYALDQERDDKAKLFAEYEKVKEHLTSCERHLALAQEEINKRTSYFQGECSRLNANAQDLVKKHQSKDKIIQDLEKSLTEERKRLTGQILNMEKFSGDSLKQKNEAMAQLFKELEETKEKLKKESEVLVVLKNNQSYKQQNLASLLQQKQQECVGLRGDIETYKAKLDKMSGENSSIVSRLNERNNDYEKAVKDNNQEKQTLLKIIRRLEEEKKALENFNSSVKGNVSEQTQKNIQLSNQITRITSENKDLIQELQYKTSQIAAITRVKIEAENKVQALLGELSTSRSEKDELGKRIFLLQKNNESFRGSSESAKGQLLEEIRRKDESISGLSNQVKEMIDSIDRLNKQLLEAHAEILRNKEGFGSSQRTYREHIQQVGLQKSKLEEQLQGTKQHLLSLQNEHQALIKKKEAEVDVLNSRIKEYMANQSIMKDKTDHTTRDYIQYRQSKESEMLALNSKNKELVKQIADLRQASENMKSEYALYQKRKESDIDDLTHRLRQLNKEHSLLKDNMDKVSREYYTFQKKKETDAETQNQRIKELIKKLEKKDQRVQELSSEIQQLEKISSAQRNNLDAAQKEELDRLKNFYVQENAELKLKITQKTSENEELYNKNQGQEKSIKELEFQVKNLKEEIRTKQRTHNEVFKNMEKSNGELLSQLKQLKLTSVMENQSNSSMGHEVESLKRTVVNLEGFISEQKNSIQSLARLLKSKDEEVESLETSNAMLRKQLVASLSNEQNSRREVLQVRSKSGSNIFQKHRNTTYRSNIHSQYGLDRKGRTAESMVASAIQNNVRRLSNERKVEGLRQSFGKDLKSLSNQIDDNLPQKEKISSSTYLQIP